MDQAAYGGDASDRAPSAEVVLDTSALGTLVKLGVAREQLDDALVRRHATIVHGPSLAQSMRGNMERVHKQFVALRDLGFERFDMAVSPSRLLRRERLGIRLVATPVENRAEWIFLNVDDRSVFEEIVLLHRPRVAEIMHPFRPTVRQTFTENWEALPEDQQRLLRRGCGGETFDPAILDPQRLTGLVPHVMRRQFGRRVAREAVAQPQSHRAHIFAAGSMALQLIATFMHSAHRPGFEWLRVDKDDRNDMNIAVLASYADYFVTDDESLRKRLRFLQAAGCASFEALSTSEFLAG